MNDFGSIMDSPDYLYVKVLEQTPALVGSENATELAFSKDGQKIVRSGES